ncbi:MAG: endonuclease [Aureispira sp.]|nr:endonuclease [Aureispira sp.]
MRQFLIVWALFGLLGSFSTTIFAQKTAQDTLSPTAKKQVAKDDESIKLGMKDFSDKARGSKGIRVVFYNVENLFYPENDPAKRDDDFTPKGLKRWSFYRYQLKLNNIYKTMMAVGGWEVPSVIGFCELENKQVLKDLISKTPLKKYKYGIVHEESTDRRGIDVGFIYRKNKFKYLSHEIIRPVFPFDSTLKTRDVLHITGQVLGKDTLHVFVNHWPSRWGGQAKSEPKRVYVASLVRKRIDEIYAKNPSAKIIVMGDFNDEVENKSLVEVLNAKGHKKDMGPTDMYNYMHALSKNWQLGSHKYQGHWGTLDHVVASAPLLSEKRKNKLFADPSGAHIFAARFLLEQDNKHMGYQPFRTYAGPRFIGGFSDHLPIYIDLWYKK